MILTRWLGPSKASQRNGLAPQKRWNAFILASQLILSIKLAFCADCIYVSSYLFSSKF